MILKLMILASVFAIGLGVSPYLVLQLPESASQAEVQQQYKKLTKKLKKNAKGDQKRQLYEAAYKQIVLDKILAGDEFVVAPEDKGEQLNFIDQQRYGMEGEINETESKKFQQAKDNLKIAHYIMFIGSSLLKLAPCIIIFFCCKRNMDAEEGRRPRNRHRRMGLAQAR